MIIENSKISVIFDDNSGSIIKIQNNIAGEDYIINGDEFFIKAIEFSTGLKDFDLNSLKRKNKSVYANYKKEKLTVEVTYSLGENNHFIEKYVEINSEKDFSLEKIVISKPSFNADKFIRMIPYHYQKNITYFGRTDIGGFFTGVEIPYDTTCVDGKSISLSYEPNIKVRSKEKLKSEPIYFGVYKRNQGEGDVLCELAQQELPLPSESDAMVEMTSTILGSPKQQRLVPILVTFNCNMCNTGKYNSEKQVENDLKVSDYAKELGIDWIIYSRPWQGDFEELSSIIDVKKFEHNRFVKKLLEYTKKKGINTLLFPTTNNTNQFTTEGKAFRSDKPDWLIYPARKMRVTRFPGIVSNRIVEYEQTVGCADWDEDVQGNCIANKPFIEWLIKLFKKELGSGYFHGFILDGDFFGGAAFITPAVCQAKNHDHLPGDSNYSSIRALSKLLSDMRQEYPNCYIWLCRPLMDLGVWTFRNADAVFTIDEFGEARSLPGFKEQPPNIIYGDKIRIWSRIRVDRHFYPPYIDQCQVFPTPEGGPCPGTPWSSENIDYVMLSSLSCSANHAYFLPPKKIVPDSDIKEIKKWLDWGRKNIRYLLVRKDLPDYPGFKTIDGSAHIINDRGFIFLFNPNKTSLDIEICLNEDTLGLKGNKIYDIIQYYPHSNKNSHAKYGQTVTWELDEESAFVLEIKPSRIKAT